MGQKVNPVGMRIGVNRDWESKWYANDKDYATFLHEDIKVRKLLEEELKDAALSHVKLNVLKKMLKSLLTLLVQALLLVKMVNVLKN